MTGDIFWFSKHQNAKKSIRDACTADNFQTRQGVISMYREGNEKGNVTLSGSKDCHEFRFSIVRFVTSVSIVTSL